MSSIAYTLKTPITVSGNKIEKIVLTEPDFESICQLGLPADQTDQKARLELMRKYLSFCSGLSDEAVGALKM